LRRLPIRTKLAIALAVPLMALLAVTVLEIVKTSAEVDDVGDQTALAKSSIGPSGIITTLQNERSWLAVELIGQVGSVTVMVEGYDETRADTDEAIQAFRDSLDDRPDEVAALFEEPLAGLEALEQVRADLDASTAPRDPSNIEFASEIFDRYTALIEPFFEATTRLSLAVDDPELRQGAELADAVARQIETFSLLMRDTIVTATLTPDGIDTAPEITQIAMLQSDFQHYAGTMQNATGRYSQLAQDHFPSELTSNTDDQITQALTTGTIDLGTLLAAANAPNDENYLGYQQGLHDLITDRADSLNSAAQARRLWFGALALLALVGATSLTWIVSRSITRPLRSLTRQAKDMAEHRLPDAVLDILETPLGDDVDVPHIAPVTVRTRDEVADVADALNTVQDSALDLAVEQAVLRRNIADSFVNLGRRNQNLLGRQLDFITELESNETEPDTLASLFRLDHLATRMRRNAESLLVLAGIEPPRKWAAPVRVTDVIRAALGEVEDYQRVTIRGVEPATILGSAAADLAHLIAEFLENALTFSPPDQKVEVRGRHRPDGGYGLAVIDAGFGMPEADIAQANRRLAGTESFTIAPSKYLGHYVAGNLAARHGIHLQLDNTPGHGVTASIDLPPGLLTTDKPTGDPITDPHGNRVIASQAARAAVDDSAVAAAAAAADPQPGASVFGLSNGGPSAPPSSPPPGEATRTASGLVKRAPRGGPGSAGPAGPAGGPSGPGVPGGPARRGDPGAGGGPGGGPGERRRPAATVPSGDLLAALSSHTGKIGQGDAGGVPGTSGAPSGGFAGTGAGAGSPGAPGVAGDAPFGPDAGGPGSGAPFGESGPGGFPFGVGGSAPGGGGGQPAAARFDPAGPGGPDAGSPYGGAPAGGSGQPAAARFDLAGPPGPGGRPDAASPFAGAPGGSGGQPAAARFDPAGGGSGFDPGNGGPGRGGPGASGAGEAGGGRGPGGEISSPVWAFLDTIPPTPARRPGGGQRRGPQPPSGPPLDPGSGGTTTSGLARRVRGAQLPTTQPLSLRRAGAQAAEPARPAPANGPAAAPLARAPAQPPAHAPAPPPPARKTGPEGAAKDVYSFLSNFTAGVQRGLDEARHSDDPQ
jgi:signal transduction histidine kinase